MIKLKVHIDIVDKITTISELLQFKDSLSLLVKNQEFKGDFLIIPDETGAIERILKVPSVVALVGAAEFAGKIFVEDLIVRAVMPKTFFESQEVPQMALGTDAAGDPIYFPNRQYTITDPETEETTTLNCTWQKWAELAGFTDPRESLDGSQVMFSLWPKKYLDVYFIVALHSVYGIFDMSELMTDPNRDIETFFAESAPFKLYTNNQILDLMKTEEWTAAEE